MVIVILGVISVVAVPRFFSTTAFTDTNTLTELQSGLNYTRNRAVTTHCAIEFRIDTAGWSVLRDGDCDSNTSTPAGCPFDFSTAVNEADGSGPLGGDAASDSGLHRLFFTPRGRLFHMTSGAGCTTLPSTAVAPGTGIALDPSATLRLDGPTGYAALQ